MISRYNGLVDIKEQLLNKSQSLLTEEQRDSFKTWSPLKISLKHQKFLTPEGEEEQIQLGARFRERFPELLNGNKILNFKHTPTQRTELSAVKFIEGLFQKTAEPLPKPITVNRDDPVLRPYKGCKLWRETVKKNKEVSLREKKAFEESDHVRNVVRDFRELTQIDHLTLFDLETIYTACAFENAWHHKFKGQSVWCSLFQNDHQLKIMEYLEDLEYYWIDGPGFGDQMFSFTNLIQKFQI